MRDVGLNSSFGTNPLCDLVPCHLVPKISSPVYKLEEGHINIDFLEYYKEQN